MIQDQLIKKVIRASAGTGKTYRLSLEYIALLLRFREQGINYREILVITFTKKATAEIRERIFEHLENIVNKTAKGQEVVDNLRSIAGLEIDDGGLEYLKAVYFQMLTNKSAVQISTIDAFTNQVFASIIAPYHGITSYEIDDRIEERVLEEIYEHLLSNEENLKITSSLFERSGKKDIDDYEQFVKSLLANRWLIHLLNDHATSRRQENGEAKDLFEAFGQTLITAVEMLRNYVMAAKPELAVRDWFKKDFYELFFDENSAAADPVEILIQKLTPTLASENAKLLLGLENFWNGSKLLRAKADDDLKEELTGMCEQSASLLADYMLLTEFAAEQQDILKIAQLTYEKYDQVKFRDKVFTYNDISYYTFRYLFDPELSLIEGDAVSNEFYDYLTSRLRFLLIDEFQDTSIVQYKILLPIIREITSGFGAKDYGGVIVVGDEKQSIYGWRGGERDLLVRMPDILSGSETHSLNRSYRSAENILRFVNELFGCQTLQALLSEQGISWPYEQVQAHRQGTAGRIQVEFRNTQQSKNGNGKSFAQKQDAIREFVEKDVLPFLKQQICPPADVAILSRKNEDLKKIAAVLDEHAVPYVLNSSASILDHRAIKPVLSLIRFLAHYDYMALLTFLRSDYVLLSGDQLKEVLLSFKDPSRNESTFDEQLAALEHLEAVVKIRSLLKSSPHAGRIPNGLLVLFKEIFESFNATDLFPLESDAKNINLFLKLVAEFQNSRQDFPLTLSGFLEYCEENREKEAWMQMGLEEANAINLMTIHKSKGLEFDTVFLYWDLNPRGSRPSASVNCFVEFEERFAAISDSSITYNYGFVLQHSKKRALYDSKIRKDNIEELNNFYVALTRAKNNLYLYFALEKSGGLGAFVVPIKQDQDLTISQIIVKALLDLQLLQLTESDEEKNHLIFQFGEEIVSGAKSEAAAEEGESIARFFNFNRSDYLQKQKERLERYKHINLKSAIIDNKSIIKGIIAHYYLSFIDYDGARTRQIARERTLAEYGTLLPQDDILRLFERLNKSIEQKAGYFSQQHWPLVFTEYTLFHPSGKELRIDRLMINKETKIVKIVDYKTGSHWEEEQIDNYVEAVKALPIVHQNSYRVEGEFWELDIQ